MSRSVQIKAALVTALLAAAAFGRSRRRSASSAVRRRVTSWRASGCSASLNVLFAPRGTEWVRGFAIGGALFGLLPLGPASRDCGRPRLARLAAGLPRGLGDVDTRPRPRSSARRRTRRAGGRGSCSPRIIGSVALASTRLPVVVRPRPAADRRPLCRRPGPAGHRRRLRRLTALGHRRRGQGGDRRPAGLAAVSRRRHAVRRHVGAALLPRGCRDRKVADRRREDAESRDRGSIQGCSSWRWSR